MVQTQNATKSDPNAFETTKHFRKGPCLNGARENRELPHTAIDDVEECKTGSELRGRLALKAASFATRVPLRRDVWHLTPLSVEKGHPPRCSISRSGHNLKSVV